ncbi:unnamed protein product [Chrysoparadoxa australica]
MRLEEPAKAEKVMKRGQLLVDLAKEGQLQEIDRITSQCPKEHLLHWFNVHMCAEAIKAGHYPVVRYMVDRGLDVQNCPALVSCLHWLAALDSPSTPLLITLLVEVRSHWLVQ